MTDLRSRVLAPKVNRHTRRLGPFSLCTRGSRFCGRWWPHICPGRVLAPEQRETAEMVAERICAPVWVPRSNEEES